jgi:hypothetical protein
VRFVAAGRVVDANTRKLEEYVPHVGTVSKDASHVLLVRSSFFDDRVNDARNGITFSEEDDDSTRGVTASEFREGISIVLKTRLAERLKESDAELRRKITAVVEREAPHYRPLLDGYFESKEFESLGQSSTEDEMLASVDIYRRREAGVLKCESKKLAKLHALSADYASAARNLTERVERQKMVALAEYVALRKIILDQLEQILQTGDDGKPHKERTLHNLIFPQRQTSASTIGFEHQLWIIDERLESHNYLASDSPIDGKTGDRPDLLIALDRPSAFSDEAQQAKGYERVALVEFKRALEDLSTVATDGLPHRQMMRYAHQIEQGKAKHVSNGRPIQVASDIRFYCYAICELPRTLLERLCRDEEFIESPTGDGAFVVKNRGRYYMEYISLSKLLEDARARNNAFFRRLGLAV